MKIFKSKKIIILIVLMLILIGAIIGKSIYDNRKKYEIEQVTSIDYLVLMENERYGVINKDGDIIVNPIYDLVQIPNPSKPVFICMSNYNEATQTYETTVLNEKSERILYEYIIVEAIQIENSTTSIPFEKSVLKYQKDGKWGLIDFQGNVITKPIYEELSGLPCKEGLLLVKEQGKYGVINIKGTQIIKSKYDGIKCDGYYTEKDKYEQAGFIVNIVTSEGYRYGYIDCNGKELLKTEYNDLNRILEKTNDKDIYLIASKNGRVGIIKNKDIITDFEYEYIEYSSESDLLIVQKNSKQGILNFQNAEVVPINYTNIIISNQYINAQKDLEVEIFELSGQKVDIEGYICITQTEDNNYNIAITSQDEYKILDNNKNAITKEIYEDIKSIDGKYYIAKKNGKYGIIDINENILVDFDYNILHILSGTNIIQGLILDNSITELFDFNIQKIASMEKANIYIMDNYVSICSDNNILYFNKEGQTVKNTDIYNNELYAIKENGKWGFADGDGNIVVNPKYDMVTEFNSYGFAGIKVEDKWGIVDSNGNVLVEPVYEILEYTPEFIGKYYKVDLGYGTPFYTNIISLNY